MSWVEPSVLTVRQRLFKSSQPFFLFCCWWDPHLIRSIFCRSCLFFVPRLYIRDTSSYFPSTLFHIFCSLASFLQMLCFLPTPFDNFCIAGPPNLEMPIPKTKMLMNENNPLLEKSNPLRKPSLCFVVTLKTKWPSLPSPKSSSSPPPLTQSNVTAKCHQSRMHSSWNMQASHTMLKLMHAKLIRKWCNMKLWNSELLLS